MTALRWICLGLLGWIGLAALLLLGLAGLATAVEGAGLGPMAALIAGMRVAPGIVVPLAPLVAAIGVGIGASRMEARGERVALEAVGLGPWRTAPGAALAGLLFGMVVFVTSDALIPALSQPAEGRWVWMEGAAVRPSDGTVVEVADGSIIEVHHRLPAPARLATARRLAEPRLASGAALAQSSLRPAQIERQGRRARAVAVALWTLLAWLPMVGAASRQLALIGLLALGWTILDLALRTAADQGQVGVWTGAWGAVAVALFFLLAHGLRAVRTRDQPPAWSQ